MVYKLQKDRYQKARGGYSRILEILCERCGNHIAYYQKDGPGILKRMYIDRIIDAQPIVKELICQSCNQILGTKINYKKENRAAYRLFVGAISKQIAKKADTI
jgi:hypothetical protein